MYIKQSLPAIIHLRVFTVLLKTEAETICSLHLMQMRGMFAYKALSNYKAGTVGVINYKTGETLVMTSTPSYDPQNKPSDIDDNDAYSGAYIKSTFNRTLRTPFKTFKLLPQFAQLRIFLTFMTEPLNVQVNMTPAAAHLLNVMHATVH